MKHKRFFRRLHLALIRCGIEFEYSTHLDSVPSYQRQVTITVNHRFVMVSIGFDVYRGVFRDELNLPHAEVVEQREAAKQ